jgi:hypothetical protein
LVGIFTRLLGAGYATWDPIKLCLPLRIIVILAIL